MTSISSSRRSFQKPGCYGAAYCISNGPCCSIVAILLNSGRSIHLCGGAPWASAISSSLDELLDGCSCRTLHEGFNLGKYGLSRSLKRHLTRVKPRV